MSDSPPSAPKVLVTGGSGFLGGHAVKQLLDLGHRVRTTVQSLDKEAAHFSAGRAKAVLDWQTRPIEETVSDRGRSMLANEV